MAPKTMFEKIWDAHIVREEAGKPTLLYVDLHLVHEVTSPQAFDGLRLSGRTVRRKDLTVAADLSSDSLVNERWHSFALGENCYSAFGARQAKGCVDASSRKNAGRGSPAVDAKSASTLLQRFRLPVRTSSHLATA